MCPVIRNLLWMNPVIKRKARNYRYIWTMSKTRKYLWESLILLLLLFMQEKHTFSKLWITIHRRIIYEVLLFSRNNLKQSISVYDGKKTVDGHDVTRNFFLEIEKCILFSDTWNKFIKNCVIFYKSRGNLYVDMSSYFL